MDYIIDANNLAGKLNILFDYNFDKKLIEMIREYNRGKGRKIILVFDSADFMGDRFQKENVEVIYTPRDNYYKSADDKIVELVELYADNNVEVMVISDDIEIQENAKRIKQKRDSKVEIKKATVFAERLKNFFEEKNEEEEDDRNLNNKQVDDINKELLQLWK